MTEAAEDGSSLAWRLLATLEGGSLLLGAGALLAYTARGRAPPPACATVALTNTTSELGRALKRRLEVYGCIVTTVTSGTTSEATSETENERSDEKFDALVVVGAQPKSDGLDGISGLVTEDVYQNIKLLETLSARVTKGGCIAWACAGADRRLGAFDNAANAFDAVLKASLTHVAKVFHCVPIWVGRCDSAERTAERLVASLVTHNTEQDTNRFSIRNAAHIVGEYLYRWLKIIT